MLAWAGLAWAGLAWAGLAWAGLAAAALTWAAPATAQTVVLDPGHGGRDPGAVGCRGLEEAPSVLEVAQQAQVILEASGVRAELTRSDDRFVGLSARAAFANDLGADLPVSAPVLQSSTHLQFILAGNGHRDTLPRPKDTSIQVRSLPQRMIAALRYSGNWSEARFRQNARRLLESLERDGIDPLGEARFARYNAPFVPGFARRNEVLITVTRLPPVVPAAQIASRSQQ